MKYYPVFIDIKEKKCVVVGGGKVGARKASTLSECGAAVVVVSLEFCGKCNSLKGKNVTLVKKPYDKSDLENAFFVFAATDSQQINRDIKKDAGRLNILCNIADAPGKSDFILPSIFERGDLVMAVSTSGASPAVAKKIREELEKNFGREYTCLLNLMGDIRKKLLSSGHNPDQHKKIFNSLLQKGIVEMIRQNRKNEIDSILYELLGEQLLGTDYSYEQFF